LPLTNKTDMRIEGDRVLQQNKL